MPIHFLFIWKTFKYKNFLFPMNKIANLKVMSQLIV